MTSGSQPLQQMIDALAPPGILVGHRLIAPGDEFALLPEEAGAFASSVVKVRRASGAARIVARELLRQFGRAPRAVPKSASGAPAWPDGIVGSLAHDAEVAIAAMASREVLTSNRRGRSTTICWTLSRPRQSAARSRTILCRLIFCSRSRRRSTKRCIRSTAFSSITMTSRCRSRTTSRRSAGGEPSSLGIASALALSRSRSSRHERHCCRLHAQLSGNDMNHLQ